jgi:hypothetical protein
MSTNSREVEQHLRAASDAVLVLVSEVEQLERHKRGVQPDDPRFEVLSSSVRATAQALAQFTKEEEAWASSAGATGVDLATIGETPDHPSLSAILDRWRKIERQLDKATPGSLEAATLFEEFQRVREEYMTAFQARERSDGGGDGNGGGGRP